MKSYFMKINNLNILSASIFIIIGTILVFNPEGTIKIISYMLGALFIAMGIIKILNYFNDKKDKNTYFKDDLVYGVVMILIGAFSIVATECLASMFRIIIGIWIIYNGILRMIYTFRFKIFGDNLWVLNLVLSLVIIGSGLFILFNSGILVVTVGIFILVYAITDLVEGFVFADNIKKMSE